MSLQRCASRGTHAENAPFLPAKLCTVVQYSLQPAHFQCRARGRRGNDVHAEQPKARRRARRSQKFDELLRRSSRGARGFGRACIYLCLSLSICTYLYLYLSPISIYRLSIYLCLAGGCVAARAVCGGRTREAHSIRGLSKRVEPYVFVVHTYIVQLQTDRDPATVGNSPWQLVSGELHSRQKS